MVDSLAKSDQMTVQADHLQRYLLRIENTKGLIGGNLKKVILIMSQTSGVSQEAMTVKTMEEDHYNQYVYFKSFLSDLNVSNLYDDAIVNQVTDVLLTTFQTSGLRSVNHGRQKARLLTITI